MEKQRFVSIHFVSVHCSNPWTSSHFGVSSCVYVCRTKLEWDSRMDCLLMLEASFILRLLTIDLFTHKILLTIFLKHFQLTFLIQVSVFRNNKTSPNAIVVFIVSDDCNWKSIFSESKLILSRLAFFYVRFLYIDTTPVDILISIGLGKYFF